VGEHTDEINTKAIQLTLTETNIKVPNKSIVNETSYHQIVLLF